jgi:hypothetical protein
LDSLHAVCNFCGSRLISPHLMLEAHRLSSCFFCRDCFPAQGALSAPPARSPSRSWCRSQASTQSASIPDRFFMFPSDFLCHRCEPAGSSFGIVHHKRFGFPLGVSPVTTHFGLQQLRSSFLTPVDSVSFATGLGSSNAESSLCCCFLRSCMKGVW